MARETREAVGLDPEVLAYLESDLMRIPDVVHDLLDGSKRTRLFVSSEGGRIDGYLATTAITEGLIAVLFGEPEAAAALLPYVPRHGVVLIAPTNLLEVIRTHLPPAPTFPMVMMAVRRGDERLLAANPSVRLSVEHAPDYARLIGMPLSRAEELLRHSTVYGVFVDGALISVASVVGRLPRASFIMGVFTAPDLRGRGYGALATSAAVADALSSSEAASLGVRADNVPAIRVYERLGFRSIGDEVWVDLGTGLKP